MRATGLIAAGAAALAMAGCGGNSKGEYIAEVDELCEQSRPEAARIKRAFNRVRRAPRGARLRLETAAVDDAVESQTGALEDLKDIGRPDGEAGEEAERFIRSNERDLADLRDYGAALKRRDRHAIAHAQEQIRAHQGETKAIAQDYGFKICGAG